MEVEADPKDEEVGKNEFCFVFMLESDSFADLLN